MKAALRGRSTTPLPTPGALVLGHPGSGIVPRRDCRQLLRTHRDQRQQLLGTLRRFAEMFQLRNQLLETPYAFGSAASGIGMIGHIGSHLRRERALRCWEA